MKSELVIAVQAVVRIVRYLTRGTKADPMDLAAGQLGERTETRLLQHVLKTAEKDNAESVIKAIDEYCENVSWMMCVGPVKGALVDTYVRSCNPRTALELGTYCGYSAVRIASAMQQPSSKLISLEISAANVEIGTQMIHHAGLSSKVQVVHGILSTKIDELKQQLKSMGASTFDFVFIDHHKEYYLPDFLLLKEAGLISKGTVVVADNIIRPGAPVYRSYMESHKEDMDVVEHKTWYEYSSLPDRVMVSTLK
ncbi:hypothetical protein CY35_09G089500 [Sphagnum magellanicum]|jgi:catechol O-methyltransferase|nr:hypothetical protein CY35_09G089500 [Sphagnum magellanicum]